VTTCFDVYVLETGACFDVETFPSTKHLCPDCGAGVCTCVLPRPARLVTETIDPYAKRTQDETDDVFALIVMGLL
jgi:hypothetical protein